MKLRRFPVLAAALLCALLLIACGADKADPPAPDWGLTLAAEDISPSALTLRFTRSGGAPTGELNTGSWFSLERQAGSKWQTVPYADGLSADSVGWDSVAWLLPAEDSVTFPVDWVWLYGELEAGTYRIAKEVMDFRGPGDYDTALFYATFTVK